MRGERFDRRIGALTAQVEAVEGIGLRRSRWRSLMPFECGGGHQQKDNRRETVINQDANFLIEAIRGGARGVDDLTNYVISITNSWTRYDDKGKIQDNGVDGYDYFPSGTLSWRANIC